MRIENRNYLRRTDRQLLDECNNISMDTDRIIVENSKKGMPTLKMKIDYQYNYIHSKYDPNSEAIRIVNDFNLEEDKEHIIVFGFGLGYHIEALTSKYPNVAFTIYEPDINILATVLDAISLEKQFDINKLSFMNRSNLEQKINKLKTIYSLKIQIYAHPFYQTHYSNELFHLYETLAKSLKNEKSRLATNLSFQKRWTINAIKNIPKIMQTPNILNDIDKDYFKGKTAILVSAGPSLDSEYEHLRFIKDNKQAYIFSVGSAINSLIEHNIYPDAACTYDPTEKNQLVFEKIKEKEISEIPLIFGSTVGYETLKNYPGNMLHMITSQDSVAPFLLNDSKDLDLVVDAPSIAIVTFQLLVKLGFRNIILVGQNLAYEKNKMYASGISYGPETMDEKLFKVKNVYGEEVFTDDGFERMRVHLEHYISIAKNVTVYNTSKGGAKINGATFIPLEQVINDYLRDNSTETEWFCKNNNYKDELVYKKTINLYNSKDQLNLLLTEMQRLIVECKEFTHTQLQSIEKKLVKFDKLLKKVKNNKYFRTVISPMVRFQTEQLAKQSKKIKAETNIKNKIEMVDFYFGEYLTEIDNHLIFTEPYIEELIETIKIDD
ncbi:motility associated factor glycosyltransferase family protein [Paraliobacillus sp. JSM ZJ581]|uniref:motility associated factor glycosyltransferase family protein n=1 Tax=Paraliobacillus sp. JSM ZJ581 TaxID=3342118 RepID=UPI0035A81CD7